MFGRRAFSVAGPATWNSLPDYIRDPTSPVDSFRRDIKLFFSRSTSVHSALGASRYALYKSTIDTDIDIWNRQAFSCHLKVGSVISGLGRATGRLSQRDGPAIVTLRWPIMVWPLGSCSRPVEADQRC